MNVDKEWQGKAVLITGGGGGIGRATAEKFLEAGAAVAVADIDQARLDEFSRAMGGRGDVAGLVVDVARVGDCQRMVSETVAKFGRLDLLVCAAGIWVEGPSERMTEEDWDRVIDINLKGTFFACRHAIPELEKTEGGIILLSSDLGLNGAAGAAIYCASKGGVSLLAKSLALELAPRGIRCNAICPCDVDTPMLAQQAERFGGGDPEGYLARLRANYPQGPRARFASAEEIADFIFAIASPRLAPLTGACLPIDFGHTAGR